MLQTNRPKYGEGIEGVKDKRITVVGLALVFAFYIGICSTLSTAAATILAEPSTSDDRIPGDLP